MHDVDDEIAMRSDLELEDSPLGIIRLDREGNVLFMNRAEESVANRRAADTVGLNYFRDIAPCTAVKKFQGRFLDLVAAPDSRAESFTFTYPFWVGPKTVSITLLPSRLDDESILIVTQIVAIE